MHARAPKLLEDIRNAADFVKTATLGVVLTVGRPHAVALHLRIIMTNSRRDLHPQECAHAGRTISSS